MDSHQDRVARMGEFDGYPVLAHDCDNAGDIGYEFRPPGGQHGNPGPDPFCRPANVRACSLAGGIPGIVATLAFLMPDIRIAIEETEYTPYYGMLEILQRKVHLIQSNAGNRFRQSDGGYDVDPVGDCEPVFLVKSNPCNPTGLEQ